MVATNQGQAHENGARQMRHKEMVQHVESEVSLSGGFFFSVSLLPSRRADGTTSKMIVTPTNCSYYTPLRGDTDSTEIMEQ